MDHYWFFYGHKANGGVIRLGYTFDAASSLQDRGLTWPGVTDNPALMRELLMGLLMSIEQVNEVLPMLTHIEWR